MGRGLDSRSLIEGLGLRQIVGAATLFPKATGLEDLDALTTFEDAALGADAAAGILETAMLGHKERV